MMKKLFLLLVLVTMVQAAETALGGTLTISQLQYTPYPAEPGQYIDVWINVQTSSYIDKVECKLIPQYPFSLDASENAQRTIGTLGPGQGFVLKYKIRVDSAAINGNNDLPISCRSEGRDWITAKTVIAIQGKAASLEISEVELNPKWIAPGSTGIVRISLKNTANSAVRNVNVKLSLTDTPFTPISGGIEKNLDVILGEETKTIEYQLAPLATAESKSYRIPLALTYQDELGNSYSSSETIGIIVGETPSLLVEVSQSDIVQAFTSGTVEFKIINNGLSDVKFLNVAAENGLNHEIADTAPKYIGTLAGDDSETIEYQIYVGDAQGKIEVPLKLTYRDSNNQEYTQTISAELRIYSSEELTKFGLVKDAGINWLLIGGIVIAGYLAYTYWWKKRGAKQQK
ncbi:MAG: COG1361 S-layer family protein [Candidatus Micrarchaeota archaeon]